jgi:hypothetical protein
MTVMKSKKNHYSVVTKVTENRNQEIVLTLNLSINLASVSTYAVHFDL